MKTLHKTLLLGTSALLSTLALAAPAQAELDVTISGFTAVQAAAFDNDTAGSTNREFQSESEIYIEAKNVTEAGLEYGALVQLESSTSDATPQWRPDLCLSGWRLGSG